MKHMILILAFAFSVPAFCQETVTTTVLPHVSTTLLPTDPALTTLPPPTPPVWVQDALIKVESIGSLGKYLSLFFQYLCILLTVMTILAGSIQGILKALAGFIKVDEFQKWVDNVMNSKFMWWLKFLAALQKPVLPADQKVLDQAKQKA